MILMNPPLKASLPLELPGGEYRATTCRFLVSLSLATPIPTLVSGGRPYNSVIVSVLFELSLWNLHTTAINLLLRAPTVAGVSHGATTLRVCHVEVFNLISALDTSIIKGCMSCESR